MGSGAEAIPEFRRWADNRQHPFRPVAFFVQYVAAVVLRAISSDCISLARKAVPTP